MIHNILAGEEGHPWKSQVMSVHKHVLDEQVRTAAMLLNRNKKS